MKKFRILAFLLIFLLSGLIIYTFANPAEDKLPEDKKDQKQTEIKDQTDDQQDTTEDQQDTTDVVILPTVLAKPKAVPNQVVLDTVAPTVVATQDITEMTNDEVTVTLTFSEEVQDINTWTRVDAKTFTRVYAESMSTFVEFKDLAGNYGSTTVEVSNIDTESTEFVPILDNYDFTNQPVLLTIVVDPSVTDLADEAYSFDGGTTWGSTNTKLYFDNESNITLAVIDRVGNISTGTISIENIDKLDPTVEVLGNPEAWTAGPVELTFNGTDENALADLAYSFDLGLTWDVINTTTVTENKTVEVWIKDKAGNILEHQAVVSFIDTLAPEFTVTGNPLTWTKDDVTLTINATDNSLLHVTEPYSFDGGLTWATSTAQVYSTNTIVEIMVKDQFGLTSEEEVTINMIDKEGPVITVNVSSLLTAHDDQYDWNAENEIYPTSVFSATDNNGNPTTLVVEYKRSDSSTWILLTTSGAGLNVDYDYDFKATATDSLGNESVETISVHVDE